MGSKRFPIHRAAAIAVVMLMGTQSLLPNAASAQAASAATEAPVLHTGTQMVVVDVTVQDKDGRPIRGLKCEDFTLTENKRPRAVSYFEDHSSQAPPMPGPRLPPMPSGTFTDYTAVPSSGALNILLLDTLNTPMAD